MSVIYFFFRCLVVKFNLFFLYDKIMLSVPWHLPNCEVQEVTPTYEGIDEYFSNSVFDELEQAKN